MEQYMELEKVKNEVQRKIGRNLLHFQQFELRLKWLLANIKIEVCASEQTSDQERKTESINKKTLGELIRLYTNHIQSLSEPEDEENYAIPNAYRLKLSFWTSADADYFDSK